MKRKQYVFVELLRFDEAGGIVEYSGGQLRESRPRWQRILSGIVSEWRTDPILRSYENPFDMPIWVLPAPEEAA